MGRLRSVTNRSHWGANRQALTLEIIAEGGAGGACRYRERSPQMKIVIVSGARIEVGSSRPFEPISDGISQASQQISLNKFLAKVASSFYICSYACVSKQTAKPIVDVLNRGASLAGIAAREAAGKTESPGNGAATV